MVGNTLMRVKAPAIGGTAVALAVALVWLFRPQPETTLTRDYAAEPPARAEPGANISAAPMAEAGLTAGAPAPAASSAANLERAPLPGEAPATPMTQFFSDLRGSGVGRDDLVVVDADPQEPVPRELAAGEQEFAREPIDAAWAAGAEADLLAKFAQMPGLELLDLQVECRSTMCRLQLTQPRAAPGVEGAKPFDALLDSVGMKPRWIMAVVDGPFGSAPLRSFAYLWRDGFAPQPPLGQPHETN